MLVQLTMGKVAQVDDADAALIGLGAWYANWSGRHWYARRMVDGRQQFMHRLIVGATAGQVVDHINGDTLDNRRANLRLATKAQNGANMAARGGASRFKGVKLDRRRKRIRWVAQISSAGANRYLGAFAHEEEAARAYDRAARELFGEFARPNFEEG